MQNRTAQSRTTLRSGQHAPLFSLPDSDMRRVDLARYRGKKNVVLYFYPRDGTPSCTMLATEFSDHEEDFARHDSVVIGVSPDDCLCHAEFRDANGVSILLLSDTECEVCAQYGVLQATPELPAQARESDPPSPASHRKVTRATFVIDKRGVVRHALYNASPRGHALQILSLVKVLPK